MVDGGRWIEKLGLALNFDTSSLRACLPHTFLRKVGKRSCLLYLDNDFRENRSLLCTVSSTALACDADKSNSFKVSMGLKMDGEVSTASSTDDVRSTTSADSSFYGRCDPQ